ncbi:MAG: ABC transporter substrate-binding protein [Alphaproteobacteria bacterium]|nr:ABC transporter substrate-binding protein [Alphaproteobacteria bacterium]MDX5368346.1 ABC transporter substrate-binding protein [Alphaproteobacteria bacterium]MDX5463141.1 ABC transporter substrate-binding protein [Alphaproteobacteria bacterium]
MKKTDTRQPAGFDRRTVLKGAAATAAVATGITGFPAYLKAANAPIKVAVPTILSGRVAILGQSSVAGLQLAAKEINDAGGIEGRKIEVVTRDSKGKPDEAARMTRDMVNNEGCEVVLNAEASGATFAVNETVRDIKKFCLHSCSETSSLTADPKNQVPWAFRSCRQGIHDAVGGGLYAAEVAKAKGLKRWATCSPDYAYGRANTEEFMEYVKIFAPDVEVITETWPKLFQPDYTENITALLNAQPDAVYSCLWGGDLVAFFDQASLYGLFDQFEAFAVNLTDYPVITAIKNLPEGVHGGSRYHKDNPDTDANEAWNEKFRANSDVLPTNWAWQNYTAMSFIIEALKKTGGNTDAERMAEATAGMTINSPFGVDGTLTMRESDHTLVNYVVGYGVTIGKEPYVKDFTTTDWATITKYEEEWKKRNGYI